MFLVITFVTFILVPVHSGDSGDSCHDADKPGTCTPLSQCQHLLDEIEAAGIPMPLHMGKRLMQLGCNGYIFKDPLVCCSSNRTSKQTFIHKLTTVDPLTNKVGVPTKVLKPIGPKTITDGTNGPQDVTNHPNLRLLPRDCGNMDENKIVGGNRTLLYEMPWMVLLSYTDGNDNKTLMCGGTLINERYVLTAAHCTETASKNRTLKGVVLGEYDIKTDPDCEMLIDDFYCAPRAVNATIEEVISHPGYSRRALFDDIALIRLAEPANFSLDNIGPICLPITRDLQRVNLDGSEGLVAGWGVTEERIQSDVLMSVQVPIITNEVCQKAFKGSPRVYSRQMCAGVRDKASCCGDSGGPLLCPGPFTSWGGLRYVQQGVVTYGPKRCGIGLPGVYTRVSHYMTWILDNMRN